MLLKIYQMEHKKAQKSQKDKTPLRSSANAKIYMSNWKLFRLNRMAFCPNYPNHSIPGHYMKLSIQGNHCFP